MPVDFGSAVAILKSKSVPDYPRLQGFRNDFFSFASLERTDHALFHLWLQRHPRVE